MRTQEQAPLRHPQHPRSLTDTRVIVVLRGDDASRLTEVARTLVLAGLTCLEVTLTIPRAPYLLRELTHQLGHAATIGAGTVTTAGQARTALGAGAQFLVSPALCPDVTAAASEHGIAHYPGAFSPTEVWRAWEAGAAAVKLFPASLLGPAAISSLAGPFPEIPLIPTGGITLDAAATWLQAGALAVGIGGPLLGDAPAGGDLTALAARARWLHATTSMLHPGPHPPA